MSKENSAAASQQGEENTNKSNAGAEGGDKGKGEGEGQTPEQIAENQRKRAEKAEADAEAAKATVATLQEQLKLAQSREGANAQIPDAVITKLSEKTGIDADALREVASTIGEYSVKAAEAKFVPMLQERDTESKKEKLEGEFNKAFDKVASSERFKDITLDKESIKQLQLADPSKTVEQIAEKLYAGIVAPKGKESSEDETRTGAQRGGGKIDFDNMTPEQHEQVMADPELKKQLFDYRDSKGI